jgi:hypothetical protein
MNFKTLIINVLNESSGDSYRANQFLNNLPINRYVKIPDYVSPSLEGNYIYIEKDGNKYKWTITEEPNEDSFIDDSDLFNTLEKCKSDLDEQL